MTYDRITLLRRSHENMCLVLKLNTSLHTDVLHCARLLWGCSSVNEEAE